MWQAYVAASRIPDPNFSDLSRFTQGDALAVFVGGLTSMRDQGLASRGDVVLNPEVVGFDQSKGAVIVVRVSDCVDTSKTALFKKSGESYQDSPGGHRAASATVNDVGGGVWKVTEFALQKVGSC